MSGMKPVESEDFWELRPGLPGVFDFLRLSALFVGYILTFFGWCGFFIAVVNPSVAGFYVPMDPHHMAGPLRYTGFLITLGWLLLRFAAGLFPFSRKMFR